MNRLTILLGTVDALNRRQQGQGLAEYALILMLVAIAVIAAITALGVTLDTAYYDRLASELFSG